MTDAAGSRPDERLPRGWRSLAFDTALALLATGLELASVTGAGGTASVPAIILAAVAGGALILRRSAPLAVLATTLAAAAAIVAVGDEPTGVAGGIALYTTAAMCERRVSLAALVPTAAIAAVLSAATADAEGRQASASFGAIVAVLLVVGIWALGAYAQTRQSIHARARGTRGPRRARARAAGSDRGPRGARVDRPRAARHRRPLGQRDAGRRARRPRRAAHLARRGRRHARPRRDQRRAEPGRAAADTRAAALARARRRVAPAAVARASWTSWWRATAPPDCPCGWR